ncbi:MAG TPA: S9 family peptidase [Acidimicrobiales bacterium]|nr:S9 family peptidase [Acidimicrobiales bacterium]
MTEPADHAASATAPAAPPVAQRVPVERRVHGETVVDEYAWLRDRDDPEVIAHLERENAYLREVLAPTAGLRRAVFDEIKARTQETDLTVPVRKGEWWYYGRTVEGQQYAIRCRRTEAGDDGTEQVLVDFNEVAGDSPYLGVGAFDVSPDHRIVAYSVDFDGAELFTMRFKDLETGAHLPDEIPGTYYGTAWSADGGTFFYVTPDEARRPYRLWRHRVGTDVSADELVYEEEDERFFLGVHLSRSERFVVLGLDSMVTSEARVLPADDPTGEFRVIEARRDGVEYDVDHQGDRFLIVTNDQAQDFRLVAAPVAAPGREHWRDVIPHVPGTRIQAAEAFAGHVVVHLRRDGLRGLRVIRAADGATHDVEFDEPVYTVTGSGDNPEYDSTLYRFHYTSLVTPASVYDYDLDARTRTLRKRQPVLGDFDPDRYESRREWATAPDGTAVPVSLVRRRDRPEGPAPTLLYGYGAYEASMDPGFSIARLSLLDRGVTFAIAHVRGGGEMGRRWYEDGKLLRKRNTFTDFIAAADHLIARGYTRPDLLAARGGSAGGLLVGAVANLAPEMFRAIVAEVPFVDNVNTILDPSLPLTVTEWEEWGNPAADAEAYRYMRSYSPYENVGGHPYPAILATAGLNDPRVSYHEPAKWVARLRATATGGAPVLLKVEMGAGHSGPSGRYDAWHDEALVLAFVLDQIGGAS